MKYVPALGFDVLTPLFDPLLALFGFGRRQRRLVVDLLDLRAGERLLDVGCGTGTQLTLARQLHPDVTMASIDLDPAVLARAWRKVSATGGVLTRPAWLVRASGDALPFADASFDAVVSTLTFHHLPGETKRRALREIHRVLAPGGRFLLVDFGQAETAVMHAFVWLVRALRLPEAPTLADNVEGRIPAFLCEAGFAAQEVAPRWRGIRFLRATRRPPLT